MSADDDDKLADDQDDKEAKNQDDKVGNNDDVQKEADEVGVTMLASTASAAATTRGSKENPIELLEENDSDEEAGASTNILTSKIRLNCRMTKNRMILRWPTNLRPTSPRNAAILRRMAQMMTII